MRDSFKYMFLLDGKKLSLVGFSEKYIKDGLYKTENQFPIPGTKHSSKNTSPLYKKSASSDKKIEEDCFISSEMFFC